MARRNRDDDLLLEEDELTAAFLGDDDMSMSMPAEQGQQQQASAPAAEDEWDEDDSVPGQLAVDVYETREKLVVKARTAGVNKNDLDVSISDNQLTRTTSSRNATGVSSPAPSRSLCRLKKKRSKPCLRMVSSPSASARSNRTLLRKSKFSNKTFACLKPHLRMGLLFCLGKP
jgi:hypothetical protein